MEAIGRNAKETLVQNYERLGLSARLSRRTGGIEKQQHDLTEDGTIPTTRDSLTFTSDKSHKIFKERAVEELRVERDPKTGAILRVLEAKPRPNPLNDSLNAIDDADENNDHEGQPMAETEVVKELEELAAQGEKPAVRKQSDREQEWIEKLVAKHGDDHQAMFWDRKLNPMQQSVGDIKRRIKKWKSSRQPTEVT
jgi:nucleolar protein 16